MKLVPIQGSEAGDARRIWQGLFFSEQVLITIADTKASEVQTLWCMQSMYSEV